MSAPALPARALRTAQTTLERLVDGIIKVVDPSLENLVEIGRSNPITSAFREAYDALAQHRRERSGLGRFEDGANPDAYIGPISQMRDALLTMQETLKHRQLCGLSEPQKQTLKPQVHNALVAIRRLYQIDVPGMDAGVAAIQS